MKPVGFIWDKGNQEKNNIKHGVSEKECEEVFQDKKIQIGNDPKHSEKEKRLSALAKTQAGRKLVVFFTIRNNMLRVISARDQSKKERRQYESNKVTN